MKNLIFIAITVCVIVGITFFSYSKPSVINVNKVPASPVVEGKNPKELKDFAITGLLPPFIEQVRD
ncbi:MAG: hypothetical protein PHU64_02135 [Candidatus Omnitrophica bacterium]|nr:hypothetical protein [Candidatus Omnitrophota bacterium]MDD5430164.1 hypothetical protein [Candidatus Omnitrophota bacterium]